MLVLDMVMVLELMSSALEAVLLEQQPQQHQQRPPMANPVGQEQQDTAQQEAEHRQLGRALKGLLESEGYKNFLESNGGKVHVAYLEMVGMRGVTVTP